MDMLYIQAGILCPQYPLLYHHSPKLKCVVLTLGAQANPTHLTFS